MHAQANLDAYFEAASPHCWLLQTQSRLNLAGDPTMPNQGQGGGGGGGGGGGHQRTPCLSRISQLS